MKCCSKLLRKTTSKIVTLAKSGQIGCARKLFDEMSQRDSVAWNAMLTSYSQAGRYQEAVDIFNRMRSSETRPDHFSLTAALSTSAGSFDLRLGTKVHALTILFGYRSITPVDNALIDMYGKCSSPSNARRVFEETSLRNEATWCSLLYAYTNLGQFEYARRVFLAMPKRVEISWNIMIAGHARHGDTETCLSVFKEMLKNSFVPDQWTLSSLMTVCSNKLEFRYGITIHCFVMKSGWISAAEAANSIISFYAETGCHDDVKKVITGSSWNAMIDANMKLGDTEEALLAFQRSPEKNVVSWTSMISGYAKNGLAERALNFFITMTRNGIEPDDILFGAVLHTCSSLAVLGIGTMVHGSLVRHGFEAYLYLGNGLVNMYAKCGDLKGSIQAFQQIPCKDIISWNAALFAFSLHGKPTEVMRFYKEMVLSGMKPDKVTFVGLFMTCSHSGLVELGHEIRESMGSDHGLSLENDHIACIVDMLGRGGFLAEAKELAHECLGRNSHEALLGQCFEHREIRSGTGFGEALRVLEPSKEMSYVVLSNLYCASGQWKDAEMVRRAMADEGVKKTPGCSWIEVKNTVTTFVAGNHHNSHYPRKAELCRMLNIVEFEMRNPCFVGA